MFEKSRLAVILCALLSLCALFGALAAPLTSNPLTMPKYHSFGSQGANVAPAGKSPTTGFDFTGEYRPILVQISNVREARPQLNLSEADIVYESILMAPGHTRYTALYSDNHPGLVGSVQSARVHHLELRAEWDCPLVFWGGPDSGNVSIYDFFKANGVKDAFRIDGSQMTEKTAYAKAFERDISRVSPHQALINLQALAADHWPQKADGTPYASKSHAFLFSATPQRGSITAMEIRIPYDAADYFPSYTFNPASRQYERWYNGVEQFDGKSGKRIVAANVIVQICGTAFPHNPGQQPIITMTGSGAMHAFIDGTHIQGTWTRPSSAERTVFRDINGVEITLLPGKTFIQVVPEGLGCSYITNEGEERRMESAAGAA